MTEVVLKLNVTILSTPIVEPGNMSVSNFEPINIIMMLHFMLFQQILALYIFISYKFSEEPEEGIDERCYRANGFFNHEDENECNK